MARGGRGGKRGGSRGRGASVAQSGGKATSFSDGKRGAGSTWTNKGGSNGQSVTSKGRQNNGAQYKVRAPGGDKARAAQTGSVKGTPAPLVGGRPTGAVSPSYPALRSGAGRGRGGSAQ
jgi:hypothetical protein